mmetsp:Transcript_26947/g.67878  ORF Transcript_26947/g.67878 Transcript_26947/m.67878 type:complete len:339 (+) Transcript_26947:152-1168(+)
MVAPAAAVRAQCRAVSCSSRQLQSRPVRRGPSGAVVAAAGTAGPAAAPLSRSNLGQKHGLRLRGGQVPLPAPSASAAAAAAPLPSDDSPSLDPVGNGFLASVRAIFFYAFTLITAIPLFVLMVAIFPFVWLFDKYKRTAEHMMNNVWAKLSTTPFYRVEIIGKENLPSNDVPAVYVANHSSYLDIYTLFHLDRNFKFISKLSNFLIPLIGWSMFMTGHIPLVRNERRSQMEALKTCRGLVEKGCSLLFFPEGTRSSDGKMHSFKKGAFSVAAKMKAPVVPITVVGAYQLMKNGDEGRLYPGTIKVVVHPMIDGSVDADTMMSQSYAAIASALPAGAVA